MAQHPHPDRLVDLGRAAGDLGRAAAATGDELLDALTMVGDHATQRAVDDAVDVLVAALREVSADMSEMALVLGSRGSSSTVQQHLGDVLPSRPQGPA